MPTCSRKGESDVRHNHLITPEGTRDLLSESCILRREAENKVCAIFSAAGYSEVRTPELEFYDVFCIDSEPIRQEQMYKLTDNRGRLLVLRPDNTMPIARMAASKLRNSPLPLRLCYNQPCYRISGIRGGSNQIHQAGVELIGAGGVRADCEVLMLALRALSSCLEDFRIELGHSGLFRALVALLPVDDAQREALRGCIEAKNYASLSDELDLIGDTPEVRALKQLPRLFGGREVLRQAAELIDNPQVHEQLCYLEHLYSVLSELGYEDKLMIDLGLVNQNDYYTGIVFSAYAHGSGERVLSGGRYDSLLANFGYDVPACGFGVNIGAMTSAMPSDTGASVGQRVLVFAAQGCEAQALSFMAELTAGDGGAEFCVCETESAAIEYAKANGFTKLYKVTESGQPEELI